MARPTTPSSLHVSRQRTCLRGQVAHGFLFLATIDISLVPPPSVGVGDMGGLCGANAPLRCHVLLSGGGVSSHFFRVNAACGARGKRLGCVWAKTLWLSLPQPTQSLPPLLVLAGRRPHADASPRVGGRVRRAWRPFALDNLSPGHSPAAPWPAWLDWPHPPTCGGGARLMTCTCVANGIERAAHHCGGPNNLAAWARCSTGSARPW